MNHFIKIKKKFRPLNVVQPSEQKRICNIQMKFHTHEDKMSGKSKRENQFVYNNVFMGQKRKFICKFAAFSDMFQL